jgi:hypothetical protein
VPGCLLFFLETESLHIAQAGLEHTILLPQPPKCWNYGYAILPLFIRPQSNQIEPYSYDLFNFNYLLKILSPNTVTLEVRASTYESGKGKGRNSTHSNFLHIFMNRFIHGETLKGFASTCLNWWFISL